MNIFLIKINRLMKLIKGFFKINPHKHWIFMLYLFFTLVSVLILFSIYLLYKIKEEQVFQVDLNQNNTQSLLKDDLLKKITDLQDIKAQKIQDTINNPSLYKDPSI
jgi:type IV secretory pathway component VirB8